MRRSARRLALVLGDQLSFDLASLQGLDPAQDVVLLAEVAEEAGHVPHHPQKIALIFSAMRHFAAALRERGLRVQYVRLDDADNSGSLPGELLRWADHFGAQEIHLTECGDWRLEQALRHCGLPIHWHVDQRFLCSREAFAAWVGGRKQLRMEYFYREMRRRSGLLMNGDGTPVGGAWNFDADNRKALPKKGVEIPPLPQLEHDEITRAVIAEVDERYPEHPGSAADFWLPVTPEDSRDWLDLFVAERLHDFGRYEDAMKADEPFLFHAIVSPMLNIGLLTVDEVVAAATRTDAPLASVEGFIRQVIGWREYMRGMYRAHPKLEHVNALHLDKRIQKYWFSGERMPKDLPLPVRTVLERVHRWGYAHHIERLMVLGNWFLLQGYAPRQVNDWFLALFVDAYDWVMVPNVMGMSQFADGGFVATKPYVSGGAYLQKMGSWWSSAQEAKDSVFTDAYWEFLERHEDVLAGNHRLGLALAPMRKRRDAKG